MPKETNKLFDDPHIKYPIQDASLSFSDYILISRDIIAKNRLDLNQNNQQKIIEANSPFEYQPLKPNQEGILLIHGLFDSPLILQDLGKKLAENGYLVRAILLPGHGTRPGALLHVTYEEWLQAANYGIQSFKNTVNKVHILGFSLGGALALMQPTLASYTLLAPVFKIRSMFAGTSNTYRALHWAWKRAAWFHMDPQETLDYAKYRSVPFNAVYQVYLLTKILRKIKPSAPCFFAVTKNDMTVCSETAIRYF
ncbi:MAG TPA: alpha/beta fold hydrolase, partial [Gammaproteobacteria bacterium]|nr:alpha/beta fold hydrolase [Gammaproteobacteria bacterium]